MSALIRLYQSIYTFSYVNKALKCLRKCFTCTHTHTHTHCRDSSKEKYVDPSSQPLTPGKPSAEAFPLEHGRLRVGGGLRTSRSYDLITDAVKEDEKAAKEKEREGEQSQATSSHVHSYSLPYGASPKYVYICDRVYVILTLHTLLPIYIIWYCDPGNFWCKYIYTLLTLT